MNSSRDDVADRNCGNNQNRYHARYSLLTPPEPPVALVPPFTRAGYRESGEGWPPPQLLRLDLTPSICSLAQSKPL
jgi:hypothetical protein